MAAALALFAERGFERTTVGDVEAAAGLTARGGALYKHFRSKDELLREAIVNRMDEINRMRGELFQLLPLDDIRSEATLLGRWILNDLEQQREIQRILIETRERFPDLRERYYREIIEPGYRTMADMIKHRFMPALGIEADAEAVAVVTGEALVGYKLTQWGFGTVPLDVDEDRLVKALLQLLIGPPRQ
jgi:AcrR family transcriptional regulator